MKTSHLLLLAVAVIAASPSLLLGQVDTRWKQHDMNRPVPPVVASRHFQHASRTGTGRPRTPSCSSTAKICRSGSRMTAARRSGKSRTDTVEVAGENGRNANKGSFRRLPIARRISRANASARRRARSAETAACFSRAFTKCRCSIPTKRKLTPTARRRRSTANILRW